MCTINNETTIMPSDRESHHLSSTSTLFTRQVSCSVAAMFSLVFTLSIYLSMKQMPLVFYQTQNISFENVQLARTLEPPREPLCSPAQRIVFLKTHKTAGTSIGTILQRYGYTRNLSFAIPAKDTPVFHCCRYFKRTDVYQYTEQEVQFEPEFGNQTWGFNMMTSHAVYSRPEMDAVVPDGLYVTSLRNPVDQFESAFVYFDMMKQAKISTNNNTNPLSVFFTNPENYRKRIRYGEKQVQNGQMYDLGFQSQYFSDPFYIRYKIRQLEREFDLVIIKEYFDESLILMKKLFCWEMDDILYIPKRIRDSGFRYNISENLRQNITKWNHADVLLYEHFNRTLWRKIEEYGAEFGQELDVFRRRIVDVTSLCEAGSQIIKDNVHHMNIIRLGNKTHFCRNLLRMDGEYTALIRKRMQVKEWKNTQDQRNTSISDLNSKQQTEKGNINSTKSKLSTNNSPISDTMNGKRITRKWMQLFKTDITSLRNPVDQFESAFVYFDMMKQAKITTNNNTNPLSVFFTNPENYRKRIRYGEKQVQNGQMYDLGFQSQYFSDPFYIKYKIRQLEREFDLVIIKEYFDESLILMKKLFCWEMDDILYIPKRIRDSGFRYNISENLRQNIREWNHADVLLYEHFNRTLWRKIEEYGAEFWQELDAFRRHIVDVTSLCEAGSQIIKDNVHHMNIIRLGNKTTFCRNLLRMDGEYTALIRKRMQVKEWKNTQRNTSISDLNSKQQTVKGNINSTKSKLSTNNSPISDTMNGKRITRVRKKIFKKIVKKIKKPVTKAGYKAVRKP
ncbi:uncharacterized protein [Amphiura filiformis]|uniref:uncharacterized protein n=1 Tax=Amphiura filiformis TaxID=82378 RepID=UPI003B222803